MATSTFSAAPDNSTDAAFRAWGSGLSAALAAIGLIQTADTGQINWTTVTHPTVTNTAQGYEIWRLNDSLQSTAPFYFKIEYGSSGIANDPSIWVTTGFGSNGSGTITTPSVRQQVGTQTNSTTPVTSYVAGDSGGFAVMMFGGTATNTQPFFLMAERSKNSVGADTGTYLAVLMAGQIGTNIMPYFYLHVSATGAILAEGSGGTFPGPYTKQSNTQATGNIALVPILPCFGFFQYPLRRAIGGLNGDWTNGDSPQVSLYSGITDSYLVFKIGGAGSQSPTWIFGPNGGTSTIYCMLMRFQ